MAIFNSNLSLGFTNRFIKQELKQNIEENTECASGCQSAETEHLVNQTIDNNTSTIQND